MTKLYIDFSSYGYDEYYPVDRYWLNYNMCLAEGCYYEITDLQQADVDLAREKIELMFDSLAGPMDTVWMGSALFNMAMRGMLGHPVPDFFYEEDRE